MTQVLNKPSFFPQRMTPILWLHTIQFYKELRRVCPIRQPVSCACVAPGGVSFNGTSLDLLLALQTDKQGISIGEQMRPSVSLKTGG